MAKPYFWPLNAPSGVAVTRAWPMEKAKPGEQTDHVHQKSAWFCHGDVIPEGIELKQKIKGVEGVDFWSEAEGHGRIVCVKVGEPETEEQPRHASSHDNEWLTADGVKILDETRTIPLLRLRTARRLLVLDIDLHADVCPITFGDTKEGSFGVRVRTEHDGGEGQGHPHQRRGQAPRARERREDGLLGPRRRRGATTPGRSTARRSAWRSSPTRTTRIRPAGTAAATG